MIESEDFHQSLVEDAVAMSNAIVLAKVNDPEGPTAQRLIDSIMSEMARDLPDGTPEELMAELARRSVRPAIVVNAIAEMIARIIHAGQQAGMTIHLEGLASPYTELAGLFDLEDE